MKSKLIGVIIALLASNVVGFDDAPDLRAIYERAELRRRELQDALKLQLEKERARLAELKKATISPTAKVVPAGRIVFRTAADREKAIGEAEAKVADLSNRAAAAALPGVVTIGTLKFPFVAGDFGSLPDPQVRLVQVLNNAEATAECSILEEYLGLASNGPNNSDGVIQKTREHRPLVLLRGLDFSDKADKTAMVVNQALHVSGTRRLKTVGGGTVTVFVLEPFDRSAFDTYVKQQAVRAAAAATTSKQDPRIQTAIQRGIEHLKRQSGVGGAGGQGQGYASLMLMAMLKAGVPVTAPEVQAALKQIESRFNIAGQYVPADTHVYEAGVTLMALANADVKKYKRHIQAIAEYLIAQQGPQGDWDYPQQRSTGDTSISQYAVLGLWEAGRSGVQVPKAVWDRAASWHVTRQLADGSFTYHPVGPGGGGGESGTHSMTAAGTGSLLVIRLHLYPTAQDIEEPVEKRAPRAKTKKFGVLEPVDPEPAEPEEKKPAGPDNYRPTVRLAAIDRAISRGIDWLAQRFTVDPPNQWKLYYLYGIERLTALANLTQLGGHDWYGEGAAHLLATQSPDGSWSNDSSGADAATSFAVLFLSKATAKMLDRKPPKREPRFGAGLLAGGRGLPDNLSEVQIEKGQVKARKLAGPVDDLLAELENAQSRDVEAAQAALVDISVIKNPEALVGQKERLLKLVRDPRPEVRRTALWALGLTDDVRLVPLLIDALSDPDPNCVIEARNALRFISKKVNPADLPEDPTPAQRAAAIAKWRQWYKTVRPYDERDDLE